MADRCVGLWVRAEAAGIRKIFTEHHGAFFTARLPSDDTLGALVFVEDAADNARGIDAKSDHQPPYDCHLKEALQRSRENGNKNRANTKNDQKESAYEFS